MNSREKLVLSLEEYSPLKRGDKGGCPSPFKGGMIVRVERTIWGDVPRNEPVNIQKGAQRSFQGCVDGVLNENNTFSTSFAPTEQTPACAKASAGRLEMGLFVAIALIFIMFLGPLTVLAQLQGDTSYPQLNQYLQIAIEQNPELQSMRMMTEADRERVRETGLLMDPEITVAYDFNPMMYDSYLGRFSVSAMQMFPWFGTLEAQRALQRSAAGVRESQVNTRQLEILRNVKITWFDLAELQEQIRITELSLQYVVDLEKLVETRFETGRAGQADILRIQMEQQRLGNRIANFEDQIHPLKARFNELLNRDAGLEIETAGEIHLQHIAFTDDELRSLIMMNNPVFDGITAERAAAEQQRRLAELNGRPSFGVGVEVMGRDFGPMSMLPDAKESIVGMATIRVPLYRSRYDSQVRQAGHRIRSIGHQEEQTANRLITELEAALEEIRSAERSVILIEEELIPRAQQALIILSEEYATGNARFDELLQIRRELLDLEFERIEAIATQNRAVAKIESLIGGGR